MTDETHTRIRTGIAIAWLIMAILTMFVSADTYKAEAPTAATATRASFEMSTIGMANASPTQPALEAVYIAEPETAEKAKTTQSTLDALAGSQTSDNVKPYKDTTERQTTQQRVPTSTTDALENTQWRYPLTEAEIRLIALVAEREDRNAMEAVAEVILNRVESDKFPDTVEKVLYQKKQFTTILRIKSTDTPSQDAIDAVLSVYRDGECSVPEAIFFAEKSVNASKIARGLVLVKQIGGTNFFKQE